MAVTVALKTRLSTRQLNSIRHGRRFISPGEREAAGRYALAAVEIISDRVERGTWHYWHCDGYLLTNLYDVLDALMNGELMQPGLREAA